MEQGDAMNEQSVVFAVILMSLCVVGMLFCLFMLLRNEVTACIMREANRIMYKHNLYHQYPMEGVIPTYDRILKSPMIWTLKGAFPELYRIEQEGRNT